eukprot:jgi/Tetstr1/423332/TSEL_014030.t1
MPGSEGGRSRPSSARGGGRRGRRGGGRGRGADWGREGGDRASADGRGAGGGADWFLHDDRDSEAPLPMKGQPGCAVDSKAPDLHVEVSSNGKRIVTPDVSAKVDRGTTERTVYVAGSPPAAPPQNMWLYADPEGVEHGPFPVHRMLNWEAKGYFDGGVQVCRFGSSHWTVLDAVLGEMVASTGAPQAQPPAAQHGGANVGAAPARGGKAGRSVHDRLQPVDPAATEQPRPQSGRQSAQGSRPAVAEVPRNERPQQRPAPAPVFATPAAPAPAPVPAGRAAPAAAAAAPAAASAPRESAIARSGMAKSMDPRYNPDMQVPDPPRKGKGRGGRGQVDRAPRPESGREREGRGRRGGGRGRGGGGGAPPQLQRISVSLFESGATLGSEAPMWRYIDLEGNIQGPFPAKDMQVWFAGGFLQPDLLVCGTGRLVSPPNLPHKSLYRPLKALMDEVAAGKKYQPISPEDVRRRNQDLAAEAKAAKAAKAKAPAKPPQQAPAPAAETAEPAKVKSEAPEGAAAQAAAPPASKGGKSEAEAHSEGKAPGESWADKTEAAEGGVPSLQSLT